VKSNKAKVLSLLVAIGLLVAVAGTVAADTSISPWIFSSATSTHSHNSLTLTYRCDTALVVDRTRSSNNNIRLNHTFNATTQCWNGAFIHSAPVSAGVFNTTTTSACSVAQGGAAAGRTTIFH